MCTWVDWNDWNIRTLWSFTTTISFPLGHGFFLYMHSCHSYSVEISFNCSLTERGNLFLLPVKCLSYEHGILVRTMFFCFRRVTKCILVKNKSLTSFSLGATGNLSSFRERLEGLLVFMLTGRGFPSFLPYWACRFWPALETWTLLAKGIYKLHSLCQVLMWVLRWIIFAHC